MPTTCCAHSDPVYRSCLDTVKMPAVGICDLCECPFEAPVGRTITECSCCEACTEMTAAVLLTSFGELVSETVDLSCWELVEDEELCEQLKPSDFRDLKEARGDAA